MKKQDIHQAVRILRQEVPKWKTPAVTVVAEKDRSPFAVLISCILSLRTKDETTAQAFKRLKKRARAPQGILKIPEDELAQIIYPVGFYRNKAKQIHSMCRDIIERYSGETPNTIEELLTLNGVGRKTANLVVTLGFGLPGICVDVHVHRITNRWGYIKTKKPDESEFALRKKLPPEYWIEINDLLVSYGQNLCKPISPFCSECKLKPYCKQIGVEKHR
ncbi:endonuclease III [bacterium]|nr:endonuclease III [bacterium]